MCVGVRFSPYRAGDNTPTAVGIDFSTDCKDGPFGQFSRPIFQQKRKNLLVFIKFTLLLRSPFRILVQK